MNDKEPGYKYKHVLLIDDVELDNFISQKLIAAYRFAETIYLNSSADSAIEFLTNLIAARPGSQILFPEVIFIDINMPLVDGFKFIELFKQSLEENLNKPKLVILTSSVFHNDKVKAESLPGGILFLNKPLTKEILEGI